jgi:hypothetical protein
LGKGGQESDIVDGNNIDQSFEQLYAAGWCVGDTAFVTEAGALVWFVSGRTGENIIRAEGPTQAAIWRVPQPRVG